jgi:hypothetical protein
VPRSRARSTTPLPPLNHQEEQEQQQPMNETE